MMNFVFFLWLIILPFYQFSLVGSLSIDNMIAPLLFAVWVIGYFAGVQKLSSSQIQNIFQSIVLATLYFISHTISLLTTQGAVWTTAYVTATNMLYFILPILYITSIKSLKSSNDAIIVVMFIASVTALLAALGLIEFDFFRQADSRLGEDYLKKSIGIIGSYGDVGILMSLSLLFVVAGKSKEVFFGKGSYIKIIVVITLIMIGLASMQSRNMILTIFTALIWYWIIGRWAKKSKLWYKKLYAMIFVSIFMSIMFVTLFYSPLLEFIQSVGGTKEAAGTVDDRLAQYSFMWDLVKNQIFIGVSANVYEVYEHEISLIHNMWLKELVQGGLISVIAMFILWWHALTVQVKNYQTGHESNTARVYISVLLGVLIATQFYPAGSLIFWVIIGMCSSVPFEKNKHMPDVISTKTKPESVANKSSSYVQLR